MPLRLHPEWKNPVPVPPLAPGHTPFRRLLAFLARRSSLGLGSEARDGSPARGSMHPAVCCWYALGALPASTVLADRPGHRCFGQRIKPEDLTSRSLRGSYCAGRMLKLHFPLIHVSRTTG